MRHRALVTGLASAALILAMSASGCSNFFEEREARQRVTEMMEAWESDPDGSSGHMQHAICQWSQGVSFMDDYELVKARNEFNQWRQQGGIYKVESWEIRSIEPATGTDGMLVSMQINGEDRTMRVYGREPIYWVR